MSLTIKTKETEQRELKVTVTVDEARVEKQMRTTARQMGRNVQVPGFRKGKAPYHVLVQRIGRDALRSEAVEALIDDIFSEMLAQVDVVPAAQPTLDDMQMEPLVFDFTIPMPPIVELGDYRDIRIEPEAVEVTDEAVDEALEQIRENHEVVEPVSRPVMEGDLVTLSGTGEVVEEESVDVIFDEERMDLLADAERTFPGTDFVSNLIGMEVGDSGEFTVTFPEEEPYLPEDEEEEEAGTSLAGKQARFEITVLDVKSRYLPELDDDLARDEGDYDTLEEMRTAVRERLEKEAEEDARAALFDEFLKQVEEGATLSYPAGLLVEELDGMLENVRNQVTRAGWRWEDYLRLQSQTEDDLREQWRDEAEERIRRGLLLRELLDTEYIEVTAADADSEIEKRTASVADPALQGQVRDYFQGQEGRTTLFSQLLMERLLDRVHEIATGVAPDLEALEAAASAAEEEE